MKLKQTFTFMTFAAAALAGLQTVKAQTTWNLAGNSNATSSSKLGTTNATPLKLTTNNKTRVFIDAAGKVGIGNSSPSTAGLVVDTKVGNTHAIFGSNTSGVSMVSNFPSIGFNSYYNNGWINMSTGFAGEIDVNPGTGTISFNNTATSIGAGIATPFINRMVIANNGFVGIGVTVFPSALLTIGDPGDNVGLFLSKSGINTGVDFRKTSTTSSFPTLSVSTDGPGNAITASSAHGNGIFAETGNATNWAGFFNGDVGTTGVFSGSDEKLKQNIRDFNSAMSIINALHPKLYQFKKDGNYALMHLPQGDHYGLIAQEVEKVLPNLVKQTKFDTRITKRGANLEKPSPADEVDFKALNYTELIPVIIKAVQELEAKQDAKIEALTQLVNKLQGSSSSAGAQSNVAVNAAKLSSASLEQNTPNPVANSTSIHYTIPAGSKAQLTITDNNGNTVKQISLSGSGKGVVNLEASTLSSGTYQYSLYVNGKLINTKQMVLIK